MRKRRRKGEQSVESVLDAAKVGDFESLLGDESNAWWNFVVERLGLRVDQLMLRIEAEDPAIGSWYLWLVYEVDESDNSIALANILIPDYENRPESALTTPEGYEQVPYLACRWPE
jgi:hypothetical protein